MVSEAPEQTGVVTIEADDPQLGTVEAQAPVVAEPVAEPAVEAPVPVADAPQEPVAPVAPQYDLSTPEGIREAAKSIPSLQQWREEGFEAGKQKAKSEAARDLGSKESVQTYHEWLAGEIARGGDLAELGKQTPQFVKAHEDATRVGLYSNLLAAAIPLVDGPEAEALQAMAATFEGNPDQLEQVAQAAINAAVGRTKVDAIQKLSLADIPESAPLHAEIAAKVAAELETELAARETAAADTRRAEGNAPAVVGAGPAEPEAVNNPQTKEEWEIAYGYGRKTHAEYIAAMNALGVKLRA